MKKRKLISALAIIICSDWIGPIHPHSVSDRLSSSSPRHLHPSVSLPVSLRPQSNVLSACLDQFAVR